MKSAIKKASIDFRNKNTDKRHLMLVDLQDAFVSGAEFIIELVDKFLREHPEYRCLDVIGKFKQWKIKPLPSPPPKPNK